MRRHVYDLVARDPEFYERSRLVAEVRKHGLANGAEDIGVEAASEYIDRIISLGELEAVAGKDGDVFKLKASGEKAPIGAGITGFGGC